MVEGREGTRGRLVLFTHTLTSSSLPMHALQVFTAPELQVPWISALGNHDYGYNVSAQIALTDTM